MTEWEGFSIRIKWVLTCLVFFALPFLLISYGLGNRWKIQEVDSVEEAYNGLDSVLLAVRRQEDPQKYFANLLTRIYTRAEKSANPHKILALGMREMDRRFPQIFRFITVDAKGAISGALNTDTKSLPKIVLRRLFDSLRQPENLRGEALTKVWTTIKPFIGSEASIESVIAQNRLLFEASVGEKGRWFYYAVGPVGGIFAHINQPATWQLLAAKDQCRRFLKYRRKFGIKMGVHDLSEPVNKSEAVYTALTDFQRTTRQHLEIGGTLFSIMGFTTTARIWASRPLSHAVSLNGHRLALLVFGSLLFTFLAILSYLVMVRGRILRFSIRWRLVVLFFFASGLPLAVVILAGWDYLHQKYKTRMRETHDSAERTLRAFDARFPQMRGLMEDRLNGSTRNCAYETPDEQKLTRHLLSTGNLFFRRSETTIYDRAGKALWLNSKAQENKAKSERNAKMMSSIVQSVVANINQEPIVGSTDSTTKMMESFGGFDNPVTQISRNLGKIVDFSLGGTKNWTFIKPFKGRTGKATNIIVSYWRKHELEELYLQKHLLGEQKSNPGLKLLAYDPERNWRLPVRFPFFQNLTTFLRNLQLRQSTTIGQLNMGSQSFLVTGIKPKELTDSLLICLIGDDAIRREIGGIQMGLWLFTIISALISVFLGVILSQRFLTPIGELSSGVAAIQKRDFVHRLPPGGLDELGDLARTFNRVMEGLSDLEVGRIVQESLFPTGMVNLGEYRVFGRTLSATELGGDYFDIQALPDGRVLFLIGDVSGHGVPAALVMAMAKALVERECELDPKPGTILQTIHAILLKTLKRRRNMTCFLGIIDPETHKLTTANAGHNFPFLFRRGAKPQPLEGASKALGAWKVLQLDVRETDMLPGDHLFLYTDGMVEAKSKDGVIGYDRMTAGVEPLLSSDPQESCTNIFAWHQGLTAGQGPQEDDITVVILSRQPARA